MGKRKTNQEIKDKVQNKSGKVEAKNLIQDDFSQGVLDELDNSLDADDEAKEIKKKNKKLKDKLNTKKVSIVVLVIIILILLLRSCGVGDKNMGPVIEQSGLVEDTHPDHITGYTAIPVVDDFTVSKSKPHITLYNPESNKGYSYLQYRFTDIETGEVIYESGLVEPGHKFSVAFGEFLEAGEYNVLVEILNFDYQDYEVRKNGGQSEIVITVFND